MQCFWKWNQEMWYLFYWFIITITIHLHWCTLEIKCPHLHILHSLYLFRCECVFVFLPLCQCEMFTAGLSVWHLFRLWSGLFHGVLKGTSQTQIQFVKQICTFSPKRELFASLSIWSLSSVGDGLLQACRLIKTTWVQTVAQHINQPRPNVNRCFS